MCLADMTTFKYPLYLPPPIDEESFKTNPANHIARKKFAVNVALFSREKSLIQYCCICSSSPQIYLSIEYFQPQAGKQTEYMPASKMC